MADSSFNLSPTVRRPILYGVLMTASVLLTVLLPLLAACLALVFLCLLAVESPTRAVLGYGFMAIGGVEAVSLISGQLLAPGLPVLAAGLVPAILLASRDGGAAETAQLREPAALEAELSSVLCKLELVRGSDLDGRQYRCLEDAIGSCERVREALDQERTLLVASQSR